MKRFIFYLISVPIILLLVVMLLPAISGGHPTRPQKSTLEMQFIAEALHQYRKETGRYPTGQTENILQQLRATNALGSQYLLYPIRRGYSIHEFVDPWGKPYRIEIGQAAEFVIRSAGKNGKFGDRNDVVLHSSSNNLVNP